MRDHVDKDHVDEDHRYIRFNISMMKTLRIRRKQIFKTIRKAKIER
jgi:hypothetical protein